MIRMKKTLIIDGVTYRESETYPDGTIPAGSVGPLLRMGQAERVTDAPPAPPAAPAPAEPTETESHKLAAKKASK
jgi:hypothetical protein